MPGHALARRGHRKKGVFVCAMILFVMASVQANFCPAGTYGTGCVKVGGNPAHGECETYAPGESNNYYCSNDGVCGQCCPQCLTAPGCASVCTQCPAGTSSTEGSTLLTHCNIVLTASCNAGYTGPASACSACAMGTYKSTTGSAACLNCPQNSWTISVASFSISACLCKIGYSGNDASACSACTAGKYKSSTVAGNCIDCPAGRYMESTGAAACVACLAGKYKAETGSTTPCTNCIAGKHTKTNNNLLGIAATTCVDCWPGFYSTQAGAET
jgi:hypothetical protein